MERLTGYNSFGGAYGIGMGCRDNADTINAIITRLAYYEDTGLTPEEVKDMAENAETRLLTWFEAKYGFPVGKLMDFCKAEEQGRLVVLPLAIGTHIFNGNEYGVSEYRVSHYTIYENEVFVTAVLPMCPSACRVFSVKGIGKTVFLTREEAEQALKEGGGENA